MSEQKDERFKCQVLLVNRGRARLYKNARYGTVTGSVGFWKFTKFKFTIGDKIKPFELDKSTFFKKNRSLPLLIVNDLTKTAIGVSLIEVSDMDKDIKLNLLAKKGFWESFAEKLKLSLGQTFLIMMAGFTLFRFIEFAISIATGRAFL